LSFLPFPLFFFSSLPLFFLLVHLRQQTLSFLLNLSQNLLFRNTRIIFQFFLQEQQSILHGSLLRMLLQISVSSFTRHRTDD
jgi:hypothetical protein